MRTFVYSAAMLFAMMATACGSGNKEVAGLPQVDVNANYPEKEISVNIFYQASRTTVYYYAFTISPESTSTDSVYTRNVYSNGKYSEQARGSLTLDTTAFTSDYSYSFDEYSGQAREDDEKLALALHCNGLEYLQGIFNRVFYSAYSTSDLGYISYN